MEALATVKQPRFFIGDSLESSDAYIELHYVWKIKEEHGRFNRAITTVEDATLDSDGCLRLSQSTRDTAIIFNLVSDGGVAVI